MNKYSVNPKLNKLMLDIEKSLLSISDTKEASLNEIRRYRKAFPTELDHNLAQHGRLLVSPYQVHELYEKYGYKIHKKSDEQVWKIYLTQVGYIARQLTKQKANG